MQCQSIQKLEFVTLQIGFVGIDGLVIASDRLVGQMEIDRDSLVLGYSSFTTTKFEIGAEFLCCFSGDKIAELAAIKVRDLRRESGTPLKEMLESAGNEAWKHYENVPFDRVTRKLIVAAPMPVWSLWQLEIDEVSIARPVLDKVIAGDPINSARHFVTNYLPKGDPIPLPVNQLVFLAAHGIVRGGKENPRGVGGLQVVVIPKDGLPRFLTTEQEQELKKRSESLDASIEDHRFLSPFAAGTRD
jgi:hypothetical protein